jgi:hypothetical protein
MAYLSNPATTTDYGVIVVGNNVNVDGNGVVSIPQSVSTTANVTFNSITVAGATDTGNLSVGGLLTVTGNVSAAKVFDSNLRVISNVTPVAGTGISISNLTSTGPTATFTISATGTTVINTTTVTANYTATATDEYIGVNSTNNITISLPAGVTGRTYTINDERGSGLGRITISPNGSEKINGSNNYQILVAYASVTLVFNSGAWRII